MCRLKTKFSHLPLWQVKFIKSHWTSQGIICIFSHFHCCWNLLIFTAFPFAYRQFIWTHKNGYHSGSVKRSTWKVTQSPAAWHQSDWTLQHLETHCLRWSPAANNSSLNHPGVKEFERVQDNSRNQTTHSSAYSMMFFPPCPFQIRRR